MMDACWICGKNPLDCNGHTYANGNIYVSEKIYNSHFIITTDEPSPNVIDGVSYVVVEPNADVEN